MRKILILFILCAYYNFITAQYVGIGTTTPGSGFEVRGTGIGAQQRITDATSGNSLVLQSGAGGFMRITGYNFGTATAQPIYMSVDGANTYINPNGGNVGIGTLTPANKLTVFSNFYGIEHSNGSVRLSTFLNSSGGWLGTLTNHSLNLFTNDGGAAMTVTPGGGVGINNTNPTPGYYLDIAGPVKSFGNTTHFVAQTTGGTNSWARFYMRSNSQSWFMGTSQAFNGNQLYIADETFGHTRFSIQPNNGSIYMQGNITQDLGGYGMPKAMVFLNGDGTIIRCYNGITGSTSSSGFSSGRIFGTSGYYFLIFPFDISSRFISVTPDSGIAFPSSASFNIFTNTELDIAVTSTVNGANTDRPVMIIVY